jgi:hypothetical protein
LNEVDKISESPTGPIKAQALANYARQSQDKEMEKTALSIRARTIRRCGELLKPDRESQWKTNGFETY